MKIIFVVLLQFSFFFSLLSADPAPEKENLGFLAEKAGMDISSKPDMSRLETAQFINSALLFIEENKIRLDKSGEEKIDALLGEYEKELLFIKLSGDLEKAGERMSKIEKARAKLKTNLAFSIIAEHRIGNPLILKEEIEIYGTPPGNSVISLAQEAAFSVKYADGIRRAVLNLRNFGYWGSRAGYSIGIPFSTQDPLLVEEAYLEFGIMSGGRDKKEASLIINAGRSYFRYGTFGFITDFLYRPANSAGVRFENGIFSADIKALSRLDLPDYYAGETTVITKYLKLQLFGFVSGLSREKLDYLRTDNDRGAGLSLSLRAKNSALIFENIYYRPSPSADNRNIYIVSADFFRDKSGVVNFKYCRYPEMTAQSKPLNRNSFDFTGEEFIRFEPDTKGYSVYLMKRFFRYFNAEFEWLAGQKETEEEIDGVTQSGTETRHKGIIRLNYSRKNRAKISFESLFDTDGDFRSKNYINRLMFRFDI